MTKAKFRELVAQDRGKAEEEYFMAFIALAGDHRRSIAVADVRERTHAAISPRFAHPSYEAARIVRFHTDATCARPAASLAAATEAAVGGRRPA